MLLTVTGFSTSFSQVFTLALDLMVHTSSIEVTSRSAEASSASPRLARMR
jgi:hypothetical protein